MAITYKEITTDLGWKYIEMLDSDKPESVAVIPIDLGNSDYQAYLDRDKPKAALSTPNV
jgi:hypothetical protein